jgi:hypothetical protein
MTANCLPIVSFLVFYAQRTRGFGHVTAKVISIIQIQMQYEHALNINTVPINISININPSCLCLCRACPVQAYWAHGAKFVMEVPPAGVNASDSEKSESTKLGLAIAATATLE